MHAAAAVPDTPAHHCCCRRCCSTNVPWALLAGSEKMDVQDHYTAWRQTQDQPSRRHGSDGPFSFCSYPFLLDPRAKSNLLHIEARFQMEQVGGVLAGLRVQRTCGGCMCVRACLHVPDSLRECMRGNGRAG